VTRLPRAEDRVALYIDIDGEMVEVEGVIQRITLRASAGINLLTRQMEKRTAAYGEVTVTIRGMNVVEPSELETKPTPDTIIVPERYREILP
jgi:hypothetical protein